MNNTTLVIKCHDKAGFMVAGKEKLLLYCTWACMTAKIMIQRENFHQAFCALNSGLLNIWCFKNC